VSISSSDVNLAANIATVTFAFSEATTDFSILGSSTTIGGTLGNLQTKDGGNTYTATFTAASGTDISNASVSVAAGSYHDSAGFAGTSGSTTNFTVDTVTPTVAVSIDNTDVNVANGTGTVTFAFSEAPVAFALGDTSAVGGTLSNLQQTDATHYTATFTGAANTDINNASVSVTAGSWQEENGNVGSGGSTALYTVDTQPPPAEFVIPVDPEMFSLISYAGAVTWAGNSLTLNISDDPIFGYGAVAQTPLLATSLLPSNIVGISFDISSSFSNVTLSFGYLVYNAAGYGQGAIDLLNYLSVPAGNLTTFSSLISGLGSGRTTSDTVTEFLGANYSPFFLNGQNHDALTSYPLFSLDFRAATSNGPGTVTFANINWITLVSPTVSVSISRNDINLAATPRL
jgi:hypothetical protein